MRWIDIEEIAIALEEMYPKQDILNISFVKLQQLVQNLPAFNDTAKSNERILEAIQAAWLEEREYEQSRK